jgi:hypothetical protein
MLLVGRSMRLLKTIAARVMIALASNPAISREADREPKPYVHDTGDVMLAEMDATSYASHRPEYRWRYVGPRTAMSDQLRAMMGRKLSNGCLAAREEMQQFIQQRTR